MPLPHSPRAVITGAGGGFGRALALELAKRNAHLIVSDVDEAGTKETVELARAAGAGSARAMRCDVTKIADVEALAAACTEGVDLVVNNAGVSSGGRVGEIPLEDWRWTLEVDLMGVIHGCHVFMPILRKQGYGHILNVASAAGLLSGPQMAAYNVAKAGVVALSETISAEIVGTKLGVTALCPTFFKTNIVKSGRFVDPKTRKTAEHLVDSGGTAADVARASLAAVDRNELYCVPMADGRWFWRLKRAAPGLFPSLIGRASRRVFR